MKKLVSALTALVAATMFAATPVALRSGANPAPLGEIAALEAITASNAPTIAVQYVATVRAYTNATAQTVKRGTEYYFGLTNWNGAAYVYTNSWNRFDYADWTVLGTNHVVTAVASTNLVVTNTYPISVPGPLYAITNSVFSAAASAHYLMATNPAVRYLSGNGKLLVTGASPDDHITIFVR